tara:strand:+ start:3768 stop:3953 length:186 start_codon:yes stop_codon:yes gene_type:complete
MYIYKAIDPKINTKEKPNFLFEGNSSSENFILARLILYPNPIIIKIFYSHSIVAGGLLEIS